MTVHAKPLRRRGIDRPRSGAGDR